jgi:predicted transcriptional regulator
MQNSTLHIKVRPELAKGLKVLAKKRETSVGELIRKAVLSCYQIDLLDLNEKQRRAIEAFQGGYISLGKLAEEMGMSAWNTPNG